MAIVGSCRQGGCGRFSIAVAGSFGRFSLAVGVVNCIAISVKAQTVSLGDGRPRRDQYSLGSHGGARNGRKSEDEGEGGVAGDRSERAGVCFRRDQLSDRRVDYKLESLKADLRLVKLAVANSGTDGSAVAPKVRVPDPKPFGGERSAKELENFLWDMETYFQAARVPDTEKVSITSMYLTGDAKLWWRSRLSDDASANRERIETWEVLKKELKDQFLPCNTSWLARESLRNLKHRDGS
ncbi:UNVERIFIED_CONTAM: hypothetical protein Scaly_0066900 [Sesamum calycinum]|uniref:Retrotransposon gag domain-containing protein n=1 Tax=Sesamum calycinum TaxID=2727403 RepID=A0AAW2SUC6_9LAMI